MKILFTIYHSLGYGGAEVSTKILAKGLEKIGHKIIFASSEKFDNFDTKIFKRFRKIPIFWIHNLYLSRFLSKIIKEENIDLIHAHDRLTSVGAIIAAKKNNKPVIVHFRDYWFACPRSSCLTPDYRNYDVCTYTIVLRFFPFWRWPWDLYKVCYLKKARRILKNADAKVANSHAIGDKLVKLNINENIFIINIPREFVDNKILDIKKRFKLRKKVITFVGSITYTKGVLNLLKLLPDIVDKDTSFLVVGDGPLLQRMKDFVEEKKLQEYVIFTGRLNIEDMPSIYAASDIVLLPSIWSEPFSGIPLEAAAMRKITIASNTGGIPSSIIDGKTGYLLDPFDISSWKKTIKKIMKDTKLRKKMGEAAYFFVKKNFDVKVIAKQVNEIYKKLS